MTDIRALLLEATSDVQVDDAAPVERVHRATRRHQLRVVAATTASVAVIAGGSIAFTYGSNGGSSGAAHRPSGSVEAWNGTKGDLVATGLGYAWTTDTIAGQTLAERDLKTGSVIGTFELAEGSTHLAIGAGRVWAFATEQPESAAVINIVNPTTGSTKTIFLRGANQRPQGIAFADGSAWLTLQALKPSVGQVWRLTPTATGVTKSVIQVPGGAGAIATTGDGQIWVERSDSSLARIVPTATSGRVHATHSIPGFNLIASSPLPDTILAVVKTGLDEVPPGSNGCSGNCVVVKRAIPIHGSVYDVATTPAGIFVSTDTPTLLHGSTVFFSNTALMKAAPTPTATVPFTGGLAVDGDGVLIAQPRGDILHWLPPAAARQG